MDMRVRDQHFGPEFDALQTEAYYEAGAKMLFSYSHIHRQMVDYLKDSLPRPEELKSEAYNRNIAARAFDVARYCLFFGIPTGVGQVVSIRTLERQIRRLKASPYLELRSLADEIATACAANPGCVWDDRIPSEPVAPTLARHVDVDEHLRHTRPELQAL